MLKKFTGTSSYKRSKLIQLLALFLNRLLLINLQLITLIESQGFFWMWLNTNNMSNKLGKVIKNKTFYLRPSLIKCLIF